MSSWRFEPDGERKSHVVGHVKGGNQVEILENEPDVGVAEGRQLAVAQSRGVGPRDFDSALGRFVEQSDDIEQRGLAAPRGAHYAYEFPFVDCEVNILESESLDFACAVQFADAVYFDD